VEEAGVPKESHNLRSGRSRSSKRMTPVKMWKKQEFHKKDTS
jgi:argininosuccinate lyase